MALRPRRPVRGIPLRAVVPNAITALALCSGLSGVRFAIAGEWERAVTMILIAGVLDGLDGRVARMLRGESRFGAELDSLADAISFGVAPALILYLWSLQFAPRIGWICSLMLAVFCVLRLARFNAQIDNGDQPRKSAGYFTGVPAPAGAGLAMLPLYLSFSGIDLGSPRATGLLSAAYLLLEEYLSGLTEHWKMIFGPLLVLVVLFARGGIAGLLRRGGDA